MACSPAHLSTFLANVGPEYAGLFGSVPKRMFVGQAVALDLESDGETLFQVGYAQSDQARLIEVGAASSVSATTACRELEGVIGSHWIVGHNILAWDLPILVRTATGRGEEGRVLRDLSALTAGAHDRSVFSRNYAIWDTLLISTLLRPWEPSHALTTSEVAHRADSDASATLRLFQKQAAEIPLDYTEFLRESEKVTPVILVQRCGRAIREAKGRSYKAPPRFLADVRAADAGNPCLIVPEMLLSWCGWVPGVQYVWPDGYANPDHFFLTAESITKEDTDASPVYELLLQIVSDAEANGVQVLVSMIPYWLRRQCDDLIRKCATPTASASGTLRWQVSTYEACLTKTDSAAQLLANGVRIAPELGILDLLEDFGQRAGNEIEGIIQQDPEMGQSAYQLRRLTKNNAPTFLANAGDRAGTYWIEYHPARSRTAKPWKLVFAPRLTTDGSSPTPPSPDGFFAPDLFIRPRWTDINTGTTLGMDCLWPTSANRAAYWRDLVSQVLSLRQMRAPGTVSVLLLDSEDELKTARRMFAELGISPTDDGTIPQFLMAGRRLGTAICAVDVVKNAPRWRQTAAELSCPVHFLLAAVPLTDWLMCLSPSADDADTGDDEENDAPSNAGESAPDEAPDRAPRFPFSNDEVEEAINLFLGPWLRSIFGDEPPSVLDARLNIATRTLKKIGQVQDVPWRPLDPLDPNQQAIFDRYAEEFGELKRSAPPTDPSAYEQFLKKYWGYSSFTPDQKPAIDAICEAQNDLLVKLPTGAGKSVVFQVPALLRGLHSRRLTVVISPLRALMRDQVDSLRKKCIAFDGLVDYLSADRDPWETSDVYQGILENRIALLYVAPERFRVARFRESLDRRFHNDGGLEFLVIDETHCVSQWGFEFRPDYFYALEEINRLYRANSSTARILLFSATVTQAVEGDLRQLLGVQKAGPLLVRPEGYRHPIQEFIRIKPEEVPVALYGEGAALGLLARSGEVERIIKAARPDANRSVVLVFVTMRRHAEALWKKLKDDMPQYRVDFFHAGMPPSERLRVYESVKRCGEGGTNVLVATKAFGMGMDIPNIHWCIHMAPPSYLEDYLQEVGRTGRGSKERAAAGLDQIECTLLHHPGDFARNHELVRRNMIQAPDLRMLWQEVLKRSAVTASGKRISILPTDGYEEMKGDRLRRGLSWLEREPVKRLSILGYLPDMLRIRIKRTILAECAKTDDSKGAVARAIMRLYDLPASTSPESPSTPVASSDGLWSFLKRFVGFLFVSAAPSPTTAEQPVPTPGKLISGEEAEIHLGAILSEAKLTCADELYRVLFALQEATAISIERELVFKKGSLAGLSETVWKWVETLVQDLVGQAYEGGRDVSPEEMMQIVYAASDSENVPTNQQTRSNTESAVRAVVRLINAAGLRIREKLNDERNLIYRYSLTDSRRKTIIWRLKALIAKAKNLEALLNDAGEGPINLGALLELLGKDGRLHDLRTAVKLVSNLGLYSTEQSLFCYSYLLEVNTTEPLLDKSGCPPVDRQMYDQLERVNRLSELRSFSAAMFARLTSDEARKQFIDDYFQVASPPELEALLGKTVGNIEDPNVPDELKQILVHVRQEAIQKALDRFRLGEEPAQHAACSHPWDRNLLVNAGPGAGKTEVLMMRAAHLIHQQGLRPEQVLILAFNRAVVHEIRARIKRLFDGLGYGAYVRRLQVRTFHAFAMANMTHEELETVKAEVLRRPDARKRTEDEVLEAQFVYFCRKCIDKPDAQRASDFARSITAGVRAILVDEFQDMNEARYGLLMGLVRAANANQQNQAMGIMVIGDDDQDILRWDRSDNPVEAGEYFRRFTQDFGPVDTLNLRVNFRSAKAIVAGSQRYINTVLSDVSQRVKEEELRPRKDAPQGDVDQAFAPSADSLVTLLEDCRQQQNERGERRSCAVLCRTNHEAARWYEALQSRVNGLRIQGRANLALIRLRHIGTWMDICQDLLRADGDRQLDPDLFRTIRQQYEASGIPEIRRKSDLKITFLWDSVLEENPRATLSYFLAFVKELRSDDYLRLLGKTFIPKWREQRDRDAVGKLLVSTIHKVKGLEFDTVAVIPSTAKFPFGARNAEADAIGSCKADEARLMYVAMTRARTELHFGTGVRERAWMRGNNYDGGLVGGVYLEGNPSEVFISWPGFDDELQEYIRRTVAEGDAVRLQRTQNSIAIHHGRRRIEYLSGGDDGIVQEIGAASVEAATLRVHAVYRYPITEDTPPNIMAQITARCKAQGWLFTVLVTGPVTP
jgi:RecQ family ATP-dependent DNA helicase